MSNDKKNMYILAACYLLCGILFTDFLTTIVIGGLTWVAYQIFYKRERKIIVCAVSCLLSFAALQYFGGMIIRRRIAQTHHLDVDHRMRPNQAAGINSDGIRCDREACDFSPDEFNIIFLGDSFTYGEKLENGRDAFPTQLEAMINARDPAVPVRTVNFGWVSSSPLLSYRLLKDIGQSYHPRLVILCLDMTDFYDDLCYLIGEPLRGVSPAAFLAHRIGVLEDVAQLHRRWRLENIWQWLRGRKAIVPDEKYFVTNQALGRSLEYMGETEKNIRNIHAYCRDVLNADFILICLPRSFQYNDRECPRNCEAHFYTVFGPYVEEPFKWLESYSVRVDFPCYSLLDDFKNTTVFPTCFEDDPHWNPNGHRVAAEAILRILQKEGFVE
ncbi:MAG: hypothetical protein JXQ75_15835 [Phycisphaerae bacterium]|nr:hypothetical protein [Phycisphaerae bacterium]